MIARSVVKKQTVCNNFIIMFANIVLEYANKYEHALTTVYNLPDLHYGN